MRKLLVHSFKSVVYILLFSLLPTTNFKLTTAYAIVDPMQGANNRFGIHILQATPDESSPASQLVNSTGGDWGYVTILIEGKDKNKNKWQEFFNDLRVRHLIPIVRIATMPDGPLPGSGQAFWKIPDIGEASVWADFLDSLNWPVKNRYVIIYNEPNQASEWGGIVDAKSYAQTLDKTITALKNKSADFFVLNAGFDASAPQQLPKYADEVFFMQEMNKEVPGIFNRLDGWVSHSYPNPGFIGPPDATGQGTVGTWSFEIQQLRNLGVSKNLPIFITETGWKHSEGLKPIYNLPDADNVAKYYKIAFDNAWNSNRIVAVTPFLLTYQEFPFDHFSFKKISSQQYYSFYDAIKNMPKISGSPVQENKAELVNGGIYSSIVAGENYTASITLKNTGQSIWNDRDQVKLVPVQGGINLGIKSVDLPRGQKIEPGQEYVFKLNLKAPQSGTYPIFLNLFEGEKQFDSNPIQFTTTVKSPVILKVISSLGWKKDFAGDYTLIVKGVNGENTKNIGLNSSGISDEFEARYLLPDYPFEFSLEKPFYKEKTINQKVYAGVNILNFNTLQPDFLSIILHPVKFWQQPFSN